MNEMNQTSYIHKLMDNKFLGGILFCLSAVALIQQFPMIVSADIASNLTNAGNTITNTIRGIATVLAVASIAGAGVVMMLPAQELVQKAKTHIFRVLGAVIIISLATVIVTFFWNLGGTGN